MWDIGDNMIGISNIESLIKGVNSGSNYNDYNVSAYNLYLIKEYGHIFGNAGLVFDMVWCFL